jgi:hypothetical protein
MLLHDAVYPKGSKLTKATTKLQSLLDDPLVKTVLQGTSIGDEDEWGVHVWLIPAIAILTRLCFRMEGMTELVNGTFIEDLSTLISSCTDGKHRKTFFEIDKEFESMMTVVKSNFVTVDSFLLSMRASLRQALIRKLAHVKSPDQAAWMKAEDYIAGLLNDDQMLTIETTDHAIKIFENCASRAIEPNTVSLADASNDDTAEVMALKAELAELRVSKATITPAAVTDSRKRSRVPTPGHPTEPKAIITCTFCKRPSHDAQRCWDIAENQLAQAAKMKSDTEDILQSKHVHKKDLKAFMAGFDDSDSIKSSWKNQQEPRVTSQTQKAHFQGKKVHYIPKAHFQGKKVHYIIKSPLPREEGALYHQQV